jgi:hypothetical protein
MIFVKSRVFVSCGQHGKKEREVARSIRQHLEARGFDVYVAVDVQTIQEINEGIIRELKNSDCFLMVNFRRDRISGSFRRKQFRGSLFSNQELAIAYALGFEKLLVVNQEGVLPEGLLRYMGINTESFRNYGDCLSIVQRAVDLAGWKPDYSRRLRAGVLRFSDEVIRYGSLVGHFLYLDVHNDRPDIAALESTARLLDYAQHGQAPLPSPIRSPLKTTGRPGFSHTVFPRSYEAFDLLCVDQEKGLRAYLNSALDIVPIPALPLTYGTWLLRYQFFAIDFPVLTVTIELTLTQNQIPSARLVEQSTD